MIAAIFALLVFPAQDGEVLTLWHAYRGAERSALEALISDYEVAHDVRVEVLALPQSVFPSKLSTALPRGQGPDLFIYAHERIGAWVEGEMLDAVAMDREAAALLLDLPPIRGALSYEDEVYGWPLAFKTVALIYDGAKVEAPKTMEELLSVAERFSGNGSFGLAYPTDEFYFHAAWLSAFGGELFDSEGRPSLDTKPAARSFTFVRDLVARGWVPDEANGALVTQLFNDRKTPFVVSGPWFLAEVDPDIEVAVAPIPAFEDGRVPRPFSTIEAVLVSKRSPFRERAHQLGRFLAIDGAKRRHDEGTQLVVHAPTRRRIAESGEPTSAGFMAQLPTTVPMSNRPEMVALWQPARRALKASLRGEDPADALARAQREVEAVLRPPPAPSSPTPFLIVVGLILLVVVGLWCMRELRAIRRGQVSTVRRIRKAGTAYAFVAPALLGLLALAVGPFVVGLVVALTHFSSGELQHFVGFANFFDILSSRGYGVFDALSFYTTLGVTLLWTGVNVALHATLGIGLALVLNDPDLPLRRTLRALLILPWAIPNYITALIWKAMFHKQFGAINGILEVFGAEPVSWFSSFWTAFCANVITNTWLGFPFMMVVALGALQSIPRELYNAAEVDGATSWQAFVHVTLPHLRVAMLPAVLLGMVWTFNMFNIIYLVSGGEPGGSTDILISEAYRWAFERQGQYGYASAYATLIFLILAGYTLLMQRLQGRREGL